MAVTKNEVAEMKNEQEKLEDFLKSELMKEGDEILAEIEADESLKDISLPEEMDEGLWKKIQKRQAEKAAYEALSEKDKEALRLGREMMMLNGDDAGKGEGQDEKNAVGKRDAERAVENDGAKVVKYSRKRKKRVYLLVAAVAVLALAAGMTSIGGAPFVTGVMKKIVGDREMVQIDSEREGNGDRNTKESEEEHFYQEVEEAFGFTPVMLGYKPVNAIIIDCEMNEELEEACMVFEYEKKTIEYQIWVNYKDKSVGYDVEDKLVYEESLLISGEEINIKEYQVDDTDLREYIAQFEYKGVYYTLNGCIRKEEFSKIINNLIF